MPKKKKHNEGEQSPSTKRITSDAEVKELDALYEYVKTVIFEYDENMILPSYFVLRLKGLAQGKRIAQDRTKHKLTYGYDTVLKTFEAKKSLIHYAFHNNHFNGESHKINWVCKLIERNINDVYLKLQQEKNFTKKEKDNIAQIIHESAQRIAKYNTTKSTMESIINNKAKKNWDDQDEDLW